MNQNDINRIYFNQNLIYYKDKIYNSGGALEISICSSTTDYKTFSAPTLHIAVVGENNFRRLCSLNYADATDLFTAIKDILPEMNNIYLSSRNNVLLKKYQFDRSLKFEFINVQSMNDRVVSVSVIHSSSDFAQVIVPYSVFSSFAIGILKYFICEFVKISFDFSTRNLLTELLETNKMIKNGIQLLPSNLIENKSITKEEFEDKMLLEEVKSFSTKTELTLDEFNQFLGKDMENIKVPDIDKISLEEKPKNLEVNSPLIINTLNKDLNILESMLTASTTKSDPLFTILSGFNKSMNLINFNFFPEISKNDLKSLAYISKYIHDLYVSLYLNKNNTIPSSFPLLKYKINDINNIDVFHLNLAYDLLLIIGFVKIFRSRMESRESDASKNGALFYLRLRLFLDSIVYSFIDISKVKIIFNTVCTNFEKYSELGFFNHYQNILKENGFNTIELTDIREFCNELNEKVFIKGGLNKNINDKHDELFKSGFLKIKSDNNLSLEQIINELIPLEIMEKTGFDLREGSETIKEVLEKIKISPEVLDSFYKRDNKNDTPEVKTKETNLLKTVKFFNNEIPERFRNDFLEYINNLKLNNYDFKNGKFEPEELGENIIKTLYVWNITDKKDEPLTTFRAKLEDCILTKDLIINGIVKEPEEKQSDEWNLELD